MRQTSDALEAHIEADEALVEGWRSKASYALLKAALSDPGRSDLRHRMMMLDALAEGESKRFKPGFNIRWSAVHFFMGFIVQFALLATISTLVILAIPSALIGAGLFEDFSQLSIVVVVLGGTILSVLAWSYVYLALWFRYLRWIPLEQTPNAASWLGFTTTCWNQTSEYWRRKEEFYAQRYGT